MKANDNTQEICHLKCFINSRCDYACTGRTAETSAKGKPDIGLDAKNPGKQDMEIIRKKGIKLDRYRMASEQMNGEGEWLGVCYRLANGEVVYVRQEPFG